MRHSALLVFPQMLLSFPTPRPARIAIVGVGNELNGDDGAGVRAVRELAGRVPASPGVLLIEGGTAPESFTGPLRRFAPDLVLEIDAAEVGERPGAQAWVDWREADGLSASTHTLPPSVLAEFLVADLNCQVALIGIQPASTEMGRNLSPDVERAVMELAGALAEWLSAEEQD